MGGRGGASGISASGVIDRRAPYQTIETEYREARGRSGSYYKDTILEAVDEGNGELSFIYAKPESREKTSKYGRTQYLTYSLRAGAENGYIFGVNWDNVKSISGQTYNLRQEIKDRGFSWDGKNKKWIKKES